MPNGKTKISLSKLWKMCSKTYEHLERPYMKAEKNKITIYACNGYSCMKVVLYWDNNYIKEGIIDPKAINAKWLCQDYLDIQLPKLFDNDATEFAGQYNLGKIEDHYKIKPTKPFNPRSFFDCRLMKPLMEFIATTHKSGPMSPAQFKHGSRDVLYITSDLEDQIQMFGLIMPIAKPEMEGE